LFALACRPARDVVRQLFRSFARWKSRSDGVAHGAISNISAEEVGGQETAVIHPSRGHPRAAPDGGSEGEDRSGAASRFRPKNKELGSFQDSRTEVVAPLRRCRASFVDRERGEKRCESAAWLPGKQPPSIVLEPLCRRPRSASRQGPPEKKKRTATKISRALVGGKAVEFEAGRPESPLARRTSVSVLHSEAMKRRGRGPGSKPRQQRHGPEAFDSRSSARAGGGRKGKTAHGRKKWPPPSRIGRSPPPGA